MDEFNELKAGDAVTRFLGGIPMGLTVTEVRDGLVHCGPWTFSTVNGAEIDEDLGWNTQFSGSYIRIGALH